jgi:CRP-like cAMP-binding protein
MGKRPEQRYATWAEFALELAAAVKIVLPPDAIPDSEKYVALKSVDMLTGLSDAELWELVRAGRWQRTAAKQAVIRENEAGQSFFFLALGQVKVTKQGRLLNMIDKKEFFGEMAYIRGGELPRHATIEAMTPLLLAEFNPDALQKMTVGAQLQLTRTLVRNLVDRLELANSRLAR